MECDVIALGLTGYNIFWCGYQFTHTIGLLELSTHLSMQVYKAEK